MLRHNRFIPIICLLSLTLATLACSIFSGQVQTLNPPTPLPPVVSPQVATDAPVVAPTPIVITATSPAPAGPEVNVNYEGVSFYLDPAVANGVEMAIEPAEPYDENMAPWGGTPAYIQIKLNGYVLNQTFHAPQILVYDTVNMTDTYGENYPKRLNELNQLLSNPGAALPNSIPFLPWWNAGQLFHFMPTTIRFQNGSGIRFLTEYGQYSAPVNNHDLFYAFQGLTDDGKAYISIILPISHPSLVPNFESVPTDEMETITQDYAGYAQKIGDELTAQAPASFVPGLDRLDILVTSLLVQR